MDWTPIVSAGVGGSIGILSSLVVSVVAHRREDLIRWDDDRLRAVSDVVSFGSLLMGWHYQRGKAIRAGVPEIERGDRDERCIEGLNQLHAAILRASILTPTLEDQFQELLDREKVLREVADGGLTKNDPKYVDSRAAMFAAIKSVRSATTALLGTSAALGRSRSRTGRPAKL